MTIESIGIKEEPAGPGVRPVAVETLNGIDHQLMKLEFGGDGEAARVSATSPLPADIAAATTANVTSRTASATSVSLLVANPARRGASIFNDSTETLYVKLGATASLTSYTARVRPGALYELPMPGFTGPIDGIWAAATGAARITELTGRQT